MVPTRVSIRWPRRLGHAGLRACVRCRWGLAFRRRFICGDNVVGMGLAHAVAFARAVAVACAVACVATVRREIRVLVTLAWALVPSAPATPAPASASTSAAGAVVSARLVVGEGGLLAQSGWDVDGRLIRELLARLRRLTALPWL